jgi:hypothetical protein
MRWFALLLLAVAAPAVAADQFDLECRGNVTSAGASAARHYRVDLKAGRWCADGDNGQCVVRPIAEVEPDLIWFERREPKFPGDLQITHYVSRTTGRWYWHLGPMETEGTCTPEQFSGFPKLETKF